MSATRLIPAGYGHAYSAEASDLEWPVGYWPDTFAVEPKLGNGMPFQRAGGNPDYVTYRQEFGSVTIKVFND